MLKYNGRIITKNDRWIGDIKLPPIPENTIRLRFTAGFTPTFHKGNGRCIAESDNIWDLTYNNPDWTWLLVPSMVETLNTNNLLEVLGGNTSNVTDMSLLFYDASNLTKVELFDTSNVTSIYNMFWGCRVLQEIPFFDFSNVENMNGAFSWCTSITSIPHFNTSKVTNFEATFIYCHWLSSVPLLDTSSAVSTSSMFSWCEHLEEVPLFDTSNASKISSMFSNCTHLKHIPLLNTSKVTEAQFMCYNCYKVESGTLAMYNQLSSLNPVPNHLRTFQNCGRDTTTGWAELLQIPNDWKGVS